MWIGLNTLTDLSMSNQFDLISFECTFVLFYISSFLLWYLDVLRWCAPQSCYVLLLLLLLLLFPTKQVIVRKKQKLERQNGMVWLCVETFPAFSSQKYDSWGSPLSKTTQVKWQTTGLAIDLISDQYAGVSPHWCFYVAWEMSKPFHWWLQKNRVKVKGQHGQNWSMRGSLCFKIRWPIRLHLL